jgi:hypothetical protein
MIAMKAVAAMKAFCQTNLGSALLETGRFLGILVSLAGVLWVIGRLTGGN